MPTPSLLARRPWRLIGAAAVLALFTWSSWQEPSLHEYAPPTTFVTLSAPALRPGPESARLRAQITALPGITACALRPDKQLLTLAYNPELLSPAQLYARLGLRPLPVAPPDPTVRQCPVPAGYVLVAERLRFALNLRRLFVRQ